MALIKLTALTHPEQPPGPRFVYVDASRVLMISPAVQASEKTGSKQAYREAMEGLFEEVKRISKEANVIPQEHEQAMQRFAAAREAANDLNAAYGLVIHVRNPLYHPEQECTEISLACGTAMEHGVMLSRVWVKESPEEVARLIDESKKGG